MSKERPLRRGKLESVRVKGAPYPATPRTEKHDRQPRPRFPVKATTRPRELREPSPYAYVAKYGGDDPRGNPDPVKFHAYHRPATLTKSLTNAADMSGAD